MDAKRIERLKVERPPKPKHYGFTWSRYFDDGHRIYWRLRLRVGGETYSVGVSASLYELRAYGIPSHRLWAARYELRRYAKHQSNSETCNPPPQRA